MSIVTYNNRIIANISSVPGAAKSLTHIKTLTASGDSTLSFVNGSSDVVLDSTYPIYLVKFINIHISGSSGNYQFKFNMSADGGSNYNVAKTTTFFYSYHYENDSGTGLTYVTGADSNGSAIFGDQLFTWSQVSAKKAELQTEYANNQYQRDRASEYPSWQDQLDDIFHNGIDGWKTTIQAVKDKYPKE